MRAAARRRELEVAALGERDVLVDYALQVFGLGKRGDDLLVTGGRMGRQIGEHRLAVRALPAEAAAELSYVAWYCLPLLKRGSVASR